MTAERPDAKAAQAMRTMAAMATPATLATCLFRAAVEQRQRRRQTLEATPATAPTDGEV